MSPTCIVVLVLLAAGLGLWLGWFLRGEHDEPPEEFR